MKSSRRARSLYNFLFGFFFAASAPYYFLKMWRRGNWRKGFGQRFGHYDHRIKQALTNRHRLWFHAVSVGEVNLCLQLIHALEPKLPNLKTIVSTTTSTGMAELERKLPSHITKIYYPVDLQKAVDRAVRILRPEAIILVEAEIWPNLLWRAQQSKIPVFLVNARLSDRSYRGYKRMGFIFRPLFHAFAGVAAQNEEDAARLTELGCRPNRIQIVGNLKFDSVRLAERPLTLPEDLLRQLGVPLDAPVLMGGSTHSGEEAILADIFLRLLPKFPNLFLILVPRHFERGREVGRELEQRGIRFVYRTEIAAHSQFAQGKVQCLLVNTTGELRHMYRVASVIFIGKSLTVRGGQNPIEAGAVGKAIVFGPHMQNFPAIAPAFIREDAAVQVRDAEELGQVMESLLGSEERRRRLGENARRVVQENQGSLERTVEMIVRRLPRHNKPGLS